ncbi:hypothetical protein SNL152K_7430 [Streptomyces sp. NL15-2K]|nr:hypothetical protein SNL152K_7430 [Streptomyces sp. NL15-2K]
MFDGRHDQVAPDTPTPRQRPRDPRLHRPRPGRREHQLVSPAPHSLGHGFPRRVQQHPSAPPLAIQPRGVGPPLVERGHQSLPGNGMKRSAGSSIEVGHTATLKRRQGKWAQGARGCVDMRLRRVGARNHNAPAVATQAALPELPGAPNDLRLTDGALGPPPREPPEGVG